jgi:hypothetical protein
VETVRIMFQGGFVGVDCSFHGGVEGGELEKLGDFYPQDVNSEQVFVVGSVKPVDRFQVLFTRSTDHYGRVTIYKIDLLGSRLAK